MKKQSPPTTVRTLDGAKGSIEGPHDGASVRIRFDDGASIVVPSGLVRAQADGTLLLAIDRSAIATSIPVVEEQLRIGKRQVEAGRVVVHVTPQVREELVDVPLTEERVEVERVEINKFISGPVAVRQEGDVTIVPVVEEVLVVEKRLMLREEVHIRRSRQTQHHVQRIPLRTEEVHILRADSPTG